MIWILAFIDFPKCNCFFAFFLILGVGFLGILILDRLADVALVHHFKCVDACKCVDAACGKSRCVEERNLILCLISFGDSNSSARFSFYNAAVDQTVAAVAFAVGGVRFRGFPIAKSKVRRTCSGYSGP